MSETVWLATCNPRGFHPLEPSAAAITLEDIAVGLSRRNRFGGFTSLPYTVAQHSVAVSRAVPEKDAAWGLLHDAAEAYLGDWPRPWKSRLYVDTPMTGGHALFPLEQIETEILEEVAQRFGLPWPIPSSVWEADDRMMATEIRDLFRETPPALAGVTARPFPDRVDAQFYPIAREQFLARAGELSIE